MIRVFLLLFFVVSSCQQKKRGVVCDRVDANSGQCIQQLNKVVADTPPPVTKPTPIIPQLPPIETTDKKEEERKITDQTLLKDIIIKSRCLDGRCWSWEGADNNNKMYLTCRAGCSNKQLVWLMEENGSIQDSSQLCGEDDEHIANNEVILICGIVEVENKTFQGTQTPTTITGELLRRGACVIHNKLPNGKEYVSVEIKPIGGCTGTNSNDKIIELTFSLSPTN